MADLYSNENFPQDVVEELRRLGHDVLTSHDAGQSNQQVSDDAVLHFATSRGRAVVTHNRRDFKLLHKRDPGHAGIIVCTEDLDFAALAQRIHAELGAGDSLHGKLISVTRPGGGS